MKDILSKLSQLDEAWAPADKDGKYIVMKNGKETKRFNSSAKAQDYAAKFGGTIKKAEKVSEGEDYDHIEAEIKKLDPSFPGRKPGKGKPLPGTGEAKGKYVNTPEKFKPVKFDKSKKVSEGETKETGKGRVHTGDYGKKHGEEDVRDQYGARIGKKNNDAQAKKDEPKKGRGRPKKGADDSGEVKTYDTKSLGDVFGGGKKPSKEVGKTSKKHSLKEYMEKVEDTQNMTAIMEGIFGNGVDHSNVANKLAKVAKVIKSVQTPEQFEVAKKYAQRMSGTLMNYQHDNMGFGSGLKANLGTMRAIHSDLAQKAKELGISYSSLDEDDTQLSMAPASSNTKVIKQGDKTIGTVDNPQAAAAMQNAISKGEMTLNTDDDQQQGMAEGYGENPDDASEDDYRRPAVRRNPRLPNPQEPDDVSDWEPEDHDEPLSHYERYVDQNNLEEDNWIQGAVKHPGALTKKAKAAHMGTQAFAKKHQHDSGKTGQQSRLAMTLNKMHEGKLAESISLAESPETLQHIISKYKHEVKNFINDPSSDMDSDLYDALFDYYSDSGEMPYGVQKARTGDPFEWIANRFDQDVHAHVVDEGSDSMRTQYPYDTHAKGTGPMAKPRGVAPVAPAKPAATSFATDPIAATTDRAYNFISGLRKPKQFSEGTDMKDIQMESWEKQLNSLLNEGITVSTSTGQQGAPDSVNISATDGDSEKLLSVLRSAGIGIFGGEEKPEVGYGIAQGGEEEPTGTGTEPELSPEVVGDGDDMLSLIKKLSGMGGEPSAEVEVGGEDYADEETPDEPQDGTLEPAGAEEEESPEQDQQDSAEDEEQEEAPEEDSDEEEQVDEGEGMCDECGMQESQCHCDHEEQVTEWANDAGGDAHGDTELANLKALLSMGGDLHRIKGSQAQGNPIRVSENQMITDWKKLSGIK